MQNMIEVVGMAYTDAYRILRNAVVDRDGPVNWNNNGYHYHNIELVLIPEPENPYDQNAIAVYSEYPTPANAKIKRSGRIGYLPRNSGVEIVERTLVNAVIKEGFKNIYVKIDVSDFIDNTVDYEHFDEESENDFYEEFEEQKSNRYYYKTRVNKFIFAFLALFFGFFGIQWFYAKQYSKGLWYLVLCLTTIPMFLGWYQGIKALLTKTDDSYLIEV